MNYYGHSSYRDNWQGMELVYSCDKIEVTGQFDFMRCQPMLDYMNHLYHYGGMAPSEEFPWKYYLHEVRYYERFAMNSYRHNFTLCFKDGFKGEYRFYFAIAYNTPTGCIADWWKLELNPNKVMTDATDWLREFLCKLKGYTRVGGFINSVEVKSVDFAIDFPVERDCVLYDRGNRGHRMIMRSKLDRTDYYGEARKNGAVTVYNKQLESKLDKPLTRMEVTVTEFKYEGVAEYFNAFSVLKYGQMGMRELPNLTQNDKAVLDLLNMHPEHLKEFNKAARRKYKPYLQDFKLPFKLSLKGFEHVMDWCVSWSNMDIGRIFGDG